MHQHLKTWNITDTIEAPCVVFLVPIPLSSQRSLLPWIWIPMCSSMHVLTLLKIIIYFSINCNLSYLSSFKYFYINGLQLYISFYDLFSLPHSLFRFILIDTLGFSSLIFLVVWSLLYKFVTVLFISYRWTFGIFPFI